MPKSRHASRAGASKVAARTDRGGSKTAARKGAASKAPRSPGDRPRKARGGKTTKPVRRKAPDATVVAPRDAPARKGTVDMDREPPARERHGDQPAPEKAPRAATTAKRAAEAEHMHRDPRWDASKLDSKWLKPKRDPRREYGLAKDRQVPRMAGMTNWFRRAPKPKSS